ncbi:MAG: peptide chain release factor N(5)-glutamine methyltransferase [Chloroflexota bacterium]
MATVQEVLHAAIERLRVAGCETPRLDAELLLSHAIGADRTAIVAYPTALVGDGSAARFDDALARREAGEPVAYIRGFKEFYGLAFAADPRALIPRPETEKLVELAEALVLRRLAASPRPHGSPPLRIADVGTGGGTIAVSLAVALRRRGALEDVEIIGTDESADALALARENAVGHGVADRVRFIEADLLPPVVAVPYEIVAANLPYVASDAMDGLPIAASFEPRTALDGGPGGLAVIGRLLGRLPEALTDDGVALLEIGSDQGERIVALAAETLPAWECTVELDLSGHPRVARITRVAHQSA